MAVFLFLTQTMWALEGLSGGHRPQFRCNKWIDLSSLKKKSFGCIYPITLAPKPLRTTSSWTTLTWNNFRSKLRQMGFYGHSSGFPTALRVFFSSPPLSIYGGAFRWSDCAQAGPLKRTCLCFYLGEITPPQELSCACLQLAHFSPNSLPWFIPPWAFCSRGGSLAIIIILLSVLSDIVRQWRVVKVEGV